MIKDLNNDFKYETFCASQTHEICNSRIFTNGSRCKTYQKGKLPLLFVDADEHNGEL